MELNKACAYYIAFLRSIYLVHQSNHWMAKGDNFYGNHLLLERIYKTAQEDVDAAAEKFVAFFGAGFLNMSAQGKIIETLMKKYQSNSMSSSLEIEQDFLKFAEEFYKKIKDQKNFSLGLDDLLCAVSNSRETAVYLLKQALSSKNKIAKRISEFKKIAQ